MLTFQIEFEASAQNDQNVLSATFKVSDIELDMCPKMIMTRIWTFSDFIVI